MSSLEQVNNLIGFADVALAFADAAKNPKLVEDLKKNLIAAVELSEQKKKEAADAVAAIAESNRIITLAEKALNDVEVARGFANKQAEIQKQDVQKALGELEGERAALKSRVDENMAKVAAHKATAEAAQKAVDDFQKQLDARDAELKVRESNVNASSTRLAEREAALVTREASLKDEEEKFAARKKRLAAMASGDEV